MSRMSKRKGTQSIKKAECVMIKDKQNLIKPVKEKQSNFELLKIVAMLMIVAHHVVTKNAFNVDTEISGISGNKLALQILGNNAFIRNNLFFLASAWFLSGKNISKVTMKYSINSCLRIERIALFYSLALCGITVLRGGVEHSSCY